MIVNNKKYSSCIPSGDDRAADFNPGSYTSNVKSSCEIIMWAFKRCRNSTPCILETLSHEQMNRNFNQQ